MLNLVKALGGVFGGGGFSTIEKIATEWIQTDVEKIEAKALLLKTLDPNGLMRRELSRRVTALYTLYILIALVMLIFESFGAGPVVNGVLAISVATGKMTELFGPITALFGTIVTVSFGVNYANVKSESGKSK